MSSRRFPHGLLPPPNPYAKWEGTRGGQLVYLGWGERNFTRDAIETHSNPGWTYWVAMKGRVRISFADGLHLFEAGEGLLSGPGVAFGFPKQAMGPTGILAWIWRDPPADPGMADSGAWHRAVFSKDEMKLLEALHRLTRFDNIENVTCESVLNHTRGLLEALFLRALDPDRVNKSKSLLHNARHWMLDHLANHHPVEALSHYLNISPITLHRLFKQETGESPGACFQRLKMDRCAQLLEMGIFSVKHVAYEMGYRHSNDFSRTFKRHFGVPPGKWKKEGQ